jgi:hypothetical protein
MGMTLSEPLATPVPNRRLSGRFLFLWCAFLSAAFFLVSLACALTYWPDRHTNWRTFTGGYGLLAKAAQNNEHKAGVVAVVTAMAGIVTLALGITLCLRSRRTSTPTNPAPG